METYSYQIIFFLKEIKYFLDKIKLGIHTKLQQ